MDVADRLGIVIIDEVAAVALSGFGPALLETHKQQIRDMIQRDKNRPSVVMWSIANEPDSNLFPEESDVYFSEIAALTREVDNGRRPITMASKLDHIAETGAKYLDILAINRYFAWYYDTAHTEIIKSFMLNEVINWVNYYKKPIIVTEYGADTIPGFHESPEFMFTEEFQLKYMREHFKAFDQLRTNSSLIGEHIWNFADFMTFQAIYRFGGNKKGIFTRQRQPKSSAHLLRHRYFLLAAEYDSYPMPEDLDELVPVFEHGRNAAHDEL